MPKIFIATPMYGGQCFGVYVQSLIGLRDVFAQMKIDSVHSMMFNESLIPRARNALTCAFLKTDCTHLFFIDADIRFNPQEVPAMIEADKDVICGIYPKKEINFPSVIAAHESGVPFEHLRSFTGSWVINLDGYQDQVTVPAHVPLKVFNGGTGFMLIKREVFEKLKPHTEVYLNDVPDQSGTIKVQEEIHRFFDTMIEPETRRLLSEDFAFCHNWRKLGGTIWAAPWVNLAHCGMYLYEGRLLQSQATAVVPEAVG